MDAPFRLPFELPRQIGEQLFPETIQAPPTVRCAVEITPLPGGAELPFDPGFIANQAQALAAETLSRRASQIQQFFVGQRQNAQLSGLGVVNKDLALPDVRLRYTALHGRERLDVVALVDARQILAIAVRDDAPDGYVAAIIQVGNLTEPGVVSYSTPGPSARWTIDDYYNDTTITTTTADPVCAVTITLNGVEIATGALPIVASNDPLPTKYILLVAAIGRDALKFQSAHNDASNPNAPPLKVAPPRKDKRLFAYPFYGTDASGPRAYALPPYKGQDSVDPFPNATDLTQYLAPDVLAANQGVLTKFIVTDVKGDALKALNRLAKNNCSITWTGPDSKIVNHVDYYKLNGDGSVSFSHSTETISSGNTTSCIAVWAEFFSRKAKRPVMASWHASAGASGPYLISDKAQLIVGEANIINAGNPFVVDLTPKNMSPETTLNTPASPDDYWWTVPDDNSGDFIDANGKTRDIFGN